VAFAQHRSSAEKSNEIATVEAQGPTFQGHSASEFSVYVDADDWERARAISRPSSAVQERILKTAHGANNRFEKFFDDTTSAYTVLSVSHFVTKLQHFQKQKSSEGKTLADVAGHV
jgi:hypothetical protein